MSGSGFGSKAMRALTRPLLNKTRVTATALLAGMVFASAPAVHGQTLPQDGQTVAGSAAISAGATTTTVTQTSRRAIIDWTGFSVGQGDTVAFVQPDAQSAILNRVTGNTSSAIAGQITGDGQVYLINPNGIVITPTARLMSAAGLSPRRSTSPTPISCMAL